MLLYIIYYCIDLFRKLLKYSWQNFTQAILVISLLVATGLGSYYFAKSQENRDWQAMVKFWQTAAETNQAANERAVSFVFDKLEEPAKEGQDE